MKFQTKLAMSSIPVLMMMANVTYAATCASPCNVNAIANPAIKLNDTTILNNQDWEIQNVGINSTNSELRIGIDGASNSFIIEDDANNNTLVVDDNSRVGIGTAAPSEELEIRSALPAIRLDDSSAGSGFIDLQFNANKFTVDNNSNIGAIVMESNGGASQTNQLYLDSNGNVGIGIANPGVSLMVGNGGDIVLDATGTTNDWAIAAGGDGLRFRRGNGSAAIGGPTAFHLENGAGSNSLVIDSTSNIGVGTASPSASLHVHKKDAVLKVTDANAAVAQRFMFEMSNKGSVGFLLTDRSQAATSKWQFASQPNEAFAASFIGTGGPEFQVGKDGAVQMGPGPTVNFALSANGHMTLLHGSATATAHITSSSREVKKGFKEINSKEVLEKIKSLEITEWQYKNDDDNGRHIGPMAEDFYKLFELGADNKHVVGTDMASIALIAAKELHGKVTLAKAETSQLKEETAKLKAENTELKQRMASLEKLVTNLASTDGGGIGSKTDKIAINMK